MRRRLISFFDRKHCPVPDELADETLNRVARRLKEEGTITSGAPAHYCHIVARFVLLEFLRKRQSQMPLDEKLTFRQTVAVDEVTQLGEEREQNEGDGSVRSCNQKCLSGNE
jgi:hypothetical protein